MSPATGPLRGQIYYADTEESGAHYWLIVSNNQRNQALPKVLTVMLTSTPPREPRPSYVAIDPHRDGFEGWVKCDKLGPTSKKALKGPKGALSPETMRAIETGLLYALGIRCRR